MATRTSLLDRSKAAFGESELARRIALASEDRSDEEAGKPSLMKLAGELELLLEPARRLVRRMDVPKAKRPQTIIVMPGFGHSPARMRYFAQQLEAAGHTAKQWGLGRNMGVSQDALDMLGERLLDVCDRYDDQVALVGWSLGGLYSRELAKLHPERISKVITMGSPFSGSLRANNVWRVYQAITGHRVDQSPIDTVLPEKPPVETIALWSPEDGAIGAQCAAGLPGERDRAIRLGCTHSGFTYTSQSILTVLAELDRMPH